MYDIIYYFFIAFLTDRRQVMAGKKLIIFKFKRWRSWIRIIIKLIGCISLSLLVCSFDWFSRLDQVRPPDSISAKHAKHIILRNCVMHYTATHITRAVRHVLTIIFWIKFTFFSLFPFSSPSWSAPRIYSLCTRYLHNRQFTQQFISSPYDYLPSHLIRGFLPFRTTNQFSPILINLYRPCFILTLNFDLIHHLLQSLLLLITCPRRRLSSSPVRITSRQCVCSTSCNNLDRYRRETTVENPFLSRTPCFNMTHHDYDQLNS